MRQVEGETLEDFADRVLVKAFEGYPDVPDDSLQVLATESFLRGCRDRSAAYAAAERKPECVHDALQEVRDSAANLRVFGRSFASTRQVTFASRDDRSQSSQDEDDQIKKLVSLLTNRMRRPGRNPSQPARNSNKTGYRYRKCLNCDEDGHSSDACSKPSVCFTCKKSGHWSRNCPLNKGDNAEKRQIKSDRSGSESAASN